MKTYKYDVAISFAGEQREYVNKLVKRLDELRIKVFIDKRNCNGFWGKDLRNLFENAFYRDARFVITIFSKEYNKKMWTQFEYNILKKRIELDENYIIPIVYDGTLPDDWPNTKEYIDVRENTIDEIALTILGKIKKQHKTDEKKSSDSALEKTEMTIVNENGVTEIVEVILAFEFKDTHKEYIIYTKKEKDTEGNITVYVSTVDRSTGEPKLIGIEDNEEWEKVVEVLYELSKSDEEEGDRPPLGPLFDNDGNQLNIII